MAISALYAVRGTLGESLGTSCSVTTGNITVGSLGGAAMVFMTLSSSAAITASSTGGYTWTQQVDRGSPGAYSLWTTPLTSGVQLIDFTGTWSGNKGADGFMMVFNEADATKFHLGSTVVSTSTAGDSSVTIQIPSEGNNGTSGVAISWWYASSLNEFFGGATGPASQTFPPTETASTAGFSVHDSHGVGTYVYQNASYEIDSLLGAHSSTLFIDSAASVGVTFRGIRCWLGDLQSTFQDSWQMI